MLSKRSIKLKPRRTSESMSTTIPSENYSKGIESMTWTNQSFMVYTYQSQQSTLTFSEKNWDIWNTKYPPFHPKFNLFFFNLGDFFSSHAVQEASLSPSFGHDLPTAVPWTSERTRKMLGPKEKAAPVLKHMAIFGIYVKIYGVMGVLNINFHTTFFSSTQPKVWFQ